MERAQCGVIRNRIGSAIDCRIGSVAGLCQVAVEEDEEGVGDSQSERLPKALRGFRISFTNAMQKQGSVVNEERRTRKQNLAINDRAIRSANTPRTILGP